MNSVTVTVTVPMDVIKRLNKLRKKMEQDPNFDEVAITLDDGTVVRMVNEN